ncbi:DNA-binding protein [Methylosinus sp. Sm6]|uniref:DNA-binding protein n=1 Tax=Methylosinus sp. Sm6 TaxID=2866948 RepID=UPI001C9A1E63|nr:DNA-binding protein [Methylosinus sp. Sm6]MBY6240035.1 DNA-binding protein [Methylosinus sp. Sm6]
MQPTPPPPHELSGDLLRGADRIAEFLFGDASERRKVYHLAETSRLPVFRLGSMLCARRSVLLEWIRHQENRGWTRPRA